MTWIRYTDELPLIDEPVLFCCEPIGNGDTEFSEVWFGWYEGQKTAGDAIAMQTDDPGHWRPATHWMDLPNRPEASAATTERNGEK